MRGIVQGLCVVLAVSILAYALPKVGTTTFSSGQVPTPSEWSTAVNNGPNWINTNYLGGGTTPTIPGGDSLDVQGTIKADTSRFTGIIDLACNIIPRADTTQILGNPTYRFRAIDTDTARVLFFVATQAGATQALGTVTVTNSFTVNSGSALNLNSLADSTDIKDASVSGADLAASLSGNKTWTGTATWRSGTDTLMAIDAQGAIVARKNPSFNAELTNTMTDTTGNATVATIRFNTERFDQGANFSNTTFTAPVTGHYYMSGDVTLVQVGASHTSFILQLVTSNRTYAPIECHAANVRSATNTIVLPWALLVDMDANDTAYCTVNVGGDTKTVDITGYTHFTGFLAN